MKISRLSFFNSRGNKIPVTFRHKINFEILGSSELSSGWKTSPKGYIDVDPSGFITDIGMLDKGESYPLSEESNITADEYESLLASDYFIKGMNVSLSDDGVSVSDMKTIDTSWLDISLSSSLQYYSDTPDASIRFFHMSSVSLKQDTSVSAVDNILNDVFGNHTVESLYPSSVFHASIYLDPVSTELVSSETIFILEDRNSEDGSTGMYRPQSRYEGLRFEFPEADTSTLFIKDSSEYAAEEGNTQDMDNMDHSMIYWSRYKSFALPEDFGGSSQVSVSGPDGNLHYIQETSYTADEAEPLIMSIGFQTDEEGCYEDTMLMYIVNMSSFAETFNPVPVGVFSIKSEAIGEDERYRTLFTDFGIPDPEDYQDVFKQSSLNEEGQDWNFINKKSKELFLSYHEIFPYVGTYKALMNAIKFLGYDDVYFKEWYLHIDSSSDGREVTYQKMDVNTGETIKSKLARYGVSMEDFMKWKKLDKLTLVYRINEEDSNEETVNGRFTYKDSSGNTHTESQRIFSIPELKNTYSYYTDEVLSKLIALKEWIEKYIIGVNCHIADITGEGLYINRIKETGYSTGMVTFTENKERTVSPYFLNTDPGSLRLVDSSAVLTVSMKEFKNNLSVQDIGSMSAFDFIKDVYYNDTFMDCTVFKNKYGTDGIIDSPDSDFLITGKDAVTPVNFDDMSYRLENDSSSGSISWLVSVPLLVRNNIIYITQGESESVFGTSPDDPSTAIPLACPVISLSRANIRQSFGNWKTNIRYTVDYVQTANGWKYVITDTADGNSIRTDDHILLKPCENASFRYTSNNKYKVPLFIFSNYRIASAAGGNEFLTPDTSYVLEIQDGWIETKEGHDSDSNIECFARIIFDTLYDKSSKTGFVQQIHIKYTYLTGRLSVFSIGDKSRKDEYLAERNQLTSDYDNTLNNLYITYLNDKQTIQADSDSDLNANKRLIQKTIDDYDAQITKLEDYISKLDPVANAKAVIMYENTISLYHSYILSYENKIEYLETEFSASENTSIEKLKDNYYSMRNSIIADKHARLEALKRDYYKINDEISVRVNHIGKYSLSSVIYDNYNVPFTNECHYNAEVWAEIPVIRILRKTAYENDSDSQEKTLVPSGSIQNFISGATYPAFMPSWKYIITNTSGNTEFNYSALSYSQGYPQENDYAKMSNATERVDMIIQDADISVADSSVRGNFRAVLCDENPQGQNMFFKDASIMIFFTNPKTGRLTTTDYNTSGPFRVTDYKRIPDIDMDAEDNNFLELEYDADSVPYFFNMRDDFMETVNSGILDTWALNVSRFNLKKDNIVNDYDSMTSDVTVITDAERGVFQLHQLVKVMFCKNESNVKYGSLPKYVSGNVYRIENVELSGTGTQTFTLDGIVNSDLLIPGRYKNGIYGNFNDDSSIACYITAACGHFENYIVKLNADGNEYNAFMGNEWDEKDFIDPTFSFYLSDFNPNNAFKEWNYNQTAGNLTDYFYTDSNFVNCTENENILLLSSDEGNSFCDWNRDSVSGSLNYITLWNVYYNSGDTSLTETKLFTVTNEALPVKFNDKGMYRISLESIDKFGNDVKTKNNYYVKI